MNQQTDKFFKDKLEHHQKPAPVAAWDRIESGMSKKNKPVAYWLRIAASLLIVAVASWMLWPSQDHTKQVAEDKHLPSTFDSTKNKMKPAPPLVNKTQAEENFVAERKINPINAAPTKEKEQKISQPVREEKSENISNVHQEIIDTSTPVALENKSENEIPEENAVATATSNMSQPSDHIKIVIKLNESEKFLDKKTLAEATSDEKKPSTLKKLLDKADDLDPLGEIRQKKNEILALNFKREKNNVDKRN